MAGEESKIYSNCYTTMNSSVLSEATEVTIDKNPNLNPVLTMALGMAGVTLGAGMMQITLDTAVPSADFEFNPDNFMTTGRLVEFGAVMGGRQMQGKMFVSRAQYKAGATASSGVVIELIGRIKPWE